MPAGGVKRAPIAPIPPEFATAIDRLAGHAPAIGASKIGRVSAYFAQKARARSSGRDVIAASADRVPPDSIVIKSI